ncbi:TPA: DNA polymerase IV [Candidatus Taylorbacteria bacterium]|nr:DNA polymerase IV [Candidatus Taylorbacteria bacterium]
MDEQLSIRSFPRAIVHFDGDAFFASVEQMLNYKLKGKPVVTGKERNIAASMSYEAKRMGVTRGMTVQEIKKVCPQAIILPSDYETYSIFARRMYEIVRMFTPDVEEYSIDECFADITGLKTHYKMSYEEIALMIKKELELRLGVTFGVGLAPNKVLAKVGSKWQKPAGFTVIPAKDAHIFLKELPIGKIWGIGSSTSVFLHKLGIRSALDFALKPLSWLEYHKLSKPYKEIWYEMRGEYVKKLVTETNDEVGSIIKSRTFTPATSNRQFVFSQLSKNIENACIKARRHGVLIRAISFYLKTQDFRYKGMDIELPVATCSPVEIVNVVSKYFNQVYSAGEKYRASGITLRSLIDQGSMSLDLFGESHRAQNSGKIFETIDTLNHKYGKHTVFLGSSFTAMVEKQHQGDRGDVPIRKNHLFLGESARKRLDIPFLGKAH